MTTARQHLVQPDSPGIYHCVSRCVRRAFLCGLDALTGKSFEHRRQWVEDRLLKLAGLFAVAVHAYAVMSNHLHVVIEIDPESAAGWTEEEVARRWARLFPNQERSEEESIALLLAQAERLPVLRARLASLSWFMRCLNEPIARRANFEDKCTGRFWEGRFKCQALLDDAALAACMAYVDLNPVRAGLADRLVDQAHTSIRLRLLQGNAGRVDSAPQKACEAPMAPVAGSSRIRFALSEAEYITLLEWTGRQLAPGKRGRLKDPGCPLLTTLNIAPEAWLEQAGGIERRFWRAVGSVEALLNHARKLGQRWLKGVGTAQVRVS